METSNITKMANGATESVTKNIPIDGAEAALKGVNGAAESVTNDIKNIAADAESNVTDVMNKGKEDLNKMTKQFDDAIPKIDGVEAALKEVNVAQPVVKMILSSIPNSTWKSVSAASLDKICETVRDAPDGDEATTVKLQIIVLVNKLMTEMMEKINKEKMQKNIEREIMNKMMGPLNELFDKDYIRMKMMHDILTIHGTGISSYLTSYLNSSYIKEKDASDRNIYDYISFNDMKEYEPELTKNDEDVDGDNGDGDNVADGAFGTVADGAFGTVADGAFGTVADGAVADGAVGAVGAVGTVADGAVGTVADGAVGTVADGAVGTVADGAVGTVADGAVGTVADGANTIVAPIDVAAAPADNADNAPANKIGGAPPASETPTPDASAESASEPPSKSPMSPEIKAPNVNLLGNIIETAKTILESLDLLIAKMIEQNLKNQVEAANDTDAGDTEEPRFVDELHQKIITAATYHLEKPEGRQMYLRQIDKLLTQSTNAITGMNSIIGPLFAQCLQSESIQTCIKTTIASIIGDKPDANQNNKSVIRAEDVQQFVNLLTVEITKLYAEKNIMGGMYKLLECNKVDNDTIYKKKVKDNEHPIQGGKQNNSNSRKSNRNRKNSRNRQYLPKKNNQTRKKH